MYRLLISLVFLCGCQSEDLHYDVIIRGGTVYDGSGQDPIVTDLAISADTIAAIGDLTSHSADVEVNAAGMAVSPGFINMLSWAPYSLIEDGRSQSDIRQGVTLEVFGEGWSLGPLNEQMKKEEVEQQGDIKYEVSWTTLGEYLDHITERATFEDPHQYAIGMQHVFVNGVQVLKDGEHTKALPGRVVRGPGWTVHHE